MKIQRALVASTLTLLLGATVGACQNTPSASPSTVGGASTPAPTGTPMTGTPPPTTTQPYDGSTPDSTGSTSSDYVLDQSLTRGTCFDRYSTTADLSDVHQVGCSAPHALEIVGTFALTTPFTGPDDPGIQTQADDCLNKVIASLTSGNDQWYQETSADVWYPSAAQVSAGHTTGYCMAKAQGSTPDNPVMLRGSLIARTFQGVSK